MPVRENVLVDDDFLGSFERPTLAAVDRVRTAGLGPCIVEVISLALRDREIRLLLASQHLLVKDLLHFFRVAHHGFCVGVLSLDVRQHLRVAWVAQPVIVIDALITVDAVNYRSPLRDGSSRVTSGAKLGRALLLENASREEEGRGPKNQSGGARENSSHQ